jgi:hypothetical protein
MGFSTDIMHDFVAKEIRSIYSSFDGWTATVRSLEGGYNRVVILERRDNGHRECVKLLVSFGTDVSSHLLEELSIKEKSADGTPVRYSVAVMVPGNADTSSVPAGIPVYTMQSFSFDGKELVWVKKPVRKEQAAVAAT